MENLQTKTGIDVVVDGITVTYGRIPSGAVEGWEEIVFYFESDETFDTELHEKIVGELISQLESQSFDHWSQWRRTRVEAVVWNEHRQVTLASFRVRDSY